MPEYSPPNNPVEINFSAEEFTLITQMAQSAGVSVENWLATAARQRAHSWINEGWKPSDVSGDEPLNEV